MNYEKGPECSMMDRDGVSNAALTELSSAAVPRGERDLAAESIFEYGSRVGFWRLMRLFAERGLPMTVFACALTLERNAPAAAAIREAGHDICCHGWCLVPGSRDATLTREAEEALWQAVFMAQPEQRREFEPSSKRRKRRLAPWPAATA